MAYYASPEEMFEKRAEKARREGNRHWALAKNDDGDFHYGKAKKFYKYAEENLAKAEKARTTGASWNKKK